MKRKTRNFDFGTVARPASFFVMATLLALAGCSSQVQATGTYVAPAADIGRQMARPRAVLVYDFTINPGTIQLDTGMKARLEAMNSTPDPQAERRQLANEVISAISETLVDAINRMGLNAIPAGPGSQPRPGDVIVQGQIVRVEAGNATRRAVIGFGAGKSEVFADVQLLRVAPGGYTVPLQTYDASANSGRTPGLALGAAGAAAGHVAMAAAGAAAGTVSRQRSGLAKDSEDLAKKVATNVGDFFAAQGWIAPN